MVQCYASSRDLISFTTDLASSLISASVIACLNVNSSLDKISAVTVVETQFKVPSYNVFTLQTLSTVLDSIEDGASFVIFTGAYIVVDSAEEMCTKNIQNKLKSAKHNFDFSLSLVA
jgi:hypothetical protein